MDIQTDKNTLLDYYNETLTFLPQDSLKKYNLRTIKSFILHVDKVDSKSIASETIFDYLTHIRTIQPPTSFQQTQKLFMTFIFPKSTIYERIGFMFYIPLWLVGLLTCVLAFILFAFNCSTIWYFVPALIFILYACRLFYKRRQNKIYGIAW